MYIGPPTERKTAHNRNQLKEDNTMLEVRTVGIGLEVDSIGIEPEHRMESPRAPSVQRRTLGTSAFRRGTFPAYHSSPFPEPPSAVSPPPSSR